MKDTIKKSLLTVGITILLVMACYYVIPYHGTRGITNYDIKEEDQLLDGYSTLPLSHEKVFEQHFVANSYCLKGINYILIGVDEETEGNLRFAVKDLAQRVLFQTSMPYNRIEPGQWENIELPTHLVQGKEYILCLENLSDTVEPLIIVGPHPIISQAETQLMIQDEPSDVGLYIGIGFRSEYTRTGKLLLCIFALFFWGLFVYGLWFRNKEKEEIILKKVFPCLFDKKGLSEQKKYYYDFLRIIAIWMVIYNHIVLNGYMLFTEECGTKIFWLEQSFSILIKTAVPLFWMMSGALLLCKEEDLKTLFQKRIFRFFVVLLIFSLLQYGYKYYFGTFDSKQDGNYFKWVYMISEGVPAYWYLYAYLGYLFMLPVLRKIAKGLKKAEFRYVFIIYTIYNGVLPMFEYFVLQQKYHLRSDFQMPVLTSSCIAFALLGYYMEYMKTKEEYTTKEFYYWLIGSFISICIVALATNYRCVENYKWSEAFTQYFFNSFVMIPTYTIFYGVKLWSMKHDILPGIKKIVSLLGQATFALMLIENILRIHMNFVFDLLMPHFGKFLGGILWVTSIVGVGLIIGTIMKKIPLLKKLL